MFISSALSAAADRLLLRGVLSDQTLMNLSEEAETCQGAAPPVTGAEDAAGRPAAAVRILNTDQDQ